MIKIIARVNNSGTPQYVPQRFYSVSLIDEKTQFVVDSKSYLTSLGYTYGNFSIVYYVIESAPILNAEFKINSVVPSRIESNANIINQVSNSAIQQYESMYNESISTIKFLMVNTDLGKIINTSVVLAIKYNYFQQLMFFRYQEPTGILPGGKCYIHKLVYQPIIVSQFLPLVVQTQIVQSFSEPNIFPIFYTSDAVYTQSIQSVLETYGSSSSLIGGLVSNTIVNEITYDISDPINYVHFGSNVSRLQTFVNKYAEISSSVNNTKNLFYTRSAIYTQQYANSIISGFTHYERSLFFDIIGAEDLSLKVVPSIDNEFLTPLITSASNYDRGNIHALTNLIPPGLSLNENNADLITLVEMIGDTFDEYWAAIKQVTALNGRLENELQLYSVKFLRQYLSSIGGGQFSSPYSTSNLYDAYLTQLQYYDINSPKISVSQYEKLILGRLIANMPFLLRNKGTRTCVSQILNIYGFSDRLLSVKEFSSNKEISNLVVSENTSNLALESGNTCSVSLTQQFLKQGKAVIIDFRIPSSVLTEIITTTGSSGTTSVYSAQINFASYAEPLTAVWYNSGSPLLSVYGHDSAITELYSTSVSLDVTGIVLSQGVSVDAIRVVESGNWQQDTLQKYLSGINVVQSVSELVSYYNFGQNIPTRVSNEVVSVQYPESSIRIQPISRVFFSSLFDKHSPAFHYSLLQSQPLDSISAVSGDTKSALFIGVDYSDESNRSFMHQSDNSVYTIIQNNKCGGDNNQSFKAFYRDANNRGVPDLNLSYEGTLRFNQQIDSTVINMIKQFNPAYINARYGLVLQNPISYRNRVGTVDMTVSSVLPQLSKTIDVTQEFILNNSRYFPEVTQLRRIYVDQDVFSTHTAIPNGVIVCETLNTQHSRIGVVPSSIPVKYQYRVNSYQTPLLDTKQSHNNYYIQKIDNGYNYNYGMQCLPINMKQIYRVLQTSVDVLYYDRKSYLTNDSRPQLLYYNLNRGTKDGTVTIVTSVTNRKLIIDRENHLTTTDASRGVKL